MALYKNSNKYHIRLHITSGHNKLIVGESIAKYDFMNLTHSVKRDKTHNNFPLAKNPNPKDIDKKNGKLRRSYLEKRIHDDYKYNFKNSARNWKMSNKDLKSVENLLKNKKNSPLDYLFRFAIPHLRCGFSMVSLEHIYYM